MIFDSFIGSGMVENLYLDTNIFTLSAFLSELQPFYYGPFRPGGHLGGHLEYLKLLKVNFYPPPTENDPWDPYLDESSEKKTLTDKKGFHEKNPLFSLTKRKSQQMKLLAT